MFEDAGLARMNQFESRGRAKGIPLLHSCPLGTEEFLLVHSREETVAFVPATLDLFQPIRFVVNNNVSSVGYTSNLFKLN